MRFVRQIAKKFLSVCFPRSRLLIRGPRSSKPKPKFALTFDDGPHPDHTPQLLDKLDQLGLHATFFVIGRNAEKYPQLIQRMAAAGHDIANHTYTHSEPHLTSVGQFLDEIKQTDGLLDRLTGHSSRFVRPPKGSLNWGKLTGLWRAKKTIVLWNVDPKDFHMKGLDDVTRWCDAYQPSDGDIVLMHDVHPYALPIVERMAVRTASREVKGSAPCWTACSTS